MKTTITALLAVGCTLLALPVLPASEPRARAYRVNAIETLNSPTIEPGASEFTVRHILGEPARKLDANTWVYERFRAWPEPPVEDDRRTLVIQFHSGRVADLLLVNSRAEVVIAARLQTKPGARELVAAK
ncbi:MAG: hypothetical protein HZC55_28140 [Verrucomicrobia bacterium]|nr:hypothetical protein [Verrucomicrobiota bacterium]